MKKDRRRKAEGGRQSERLFAAYCLVPTAFSSFILHPFVLYSRRFTEVPLRLEPDKPHDGQRPSGSLRETNLNRNPGPSGRGAGEQPAAPLLPVSFDANNLLRGFLLE